MSVDVEGEDAVFAVFDLRGERFDAEGMPASSLAEISAYSSAVYEAARQIWLEGSGRARVPTGFPEAFDLRLVEIKDGSARPQLVLRRPARVSQADMNEWEPVFAAGRDAVTNALYAVATKGTIPSQFAFGSRAGRGLRRLGASLHPDETITVGSPEGGTHAVVDHSFREVIRRIDEVLDDTPPAIERVEGVITEFDGDKQSFKLRPTVSSRLINCLVYLSDRDVARIAKEALAPDGITAPDVLVVGPATFMPDSDDIKQLLVHEVSVVRTYPDKQFREQMGRISGLRDGWLGPSSRGLWEGADNVLADVAGAYSQLEGPPRVTLVASSEGTPVLEWRVGTRECTAELESSTRMFFVADDVETDEVDEEQVPLDLRSLMQFVATGRWR